MKSFFSNKKGIGLIGLGLLAIVGLMLMGMFYLSIDGFTKNIYDRVENSYLESNLSKEIVNERSSQQSDTWDAAFLFLFAGIWIAGLIIGYYSDYGRFIMVFMIFLLLILLWGSGTVLNYWEEQSQSDLLASQADYPYTYFLLDNLLLITLVIVGSGFMVHFMRDY